MLFGEFKTCFIYNNVLDRQLTLCLIDSSIHTKPLIFKSDTNNNNVNKVIDFS